MILPEVFVVSLPTHRSRRRRLRPKRSDAQTNARHGNEAADQSGRKRPDDEVQTIEPAGDGPRRDAEDQRHPND